MDEQIGGRALLRRLKDEVPHYARLLPELPRLLHDALSGRIGNTPRPTDDTALLAEMLREQRRTNRLLAGLTWGVAGFLLGALAARYALLWAGA
jgi:ubiquinone biosynthesis protein